MPEPTWLFSDWPAPANVGAAFTTRQGGYSQGPWHSFNLGLHVGDNPAHVQANRKALREQLGLAREPCWLQQVHGVTVVLAEQVQPGVQATREADASYTREPGLGCVIMAADCLPVLLCDRAGSVVGAAHAGWRGLAGGVLGSVVQAMGAPPGELMACLGPAISQPCFQVGEEVRRAFAGSARNASHRRDIHNSFRASPDTPDHWLADLYSLARAELKVLGITAVYGGEYCTFRQADWFYSYRRDGVTGRMASLIWIKP